MATDPLETYEKLWVSDFFHSFPHIDFSFKIVNSSFEPNNDNYRQALGFWVLVPVAVCFLLWLVFLFYFIFRCCQQQRKSKGHPHTCQRICTGLLIFIGAALVGFGLYENEKAHHGVDDVLHSRHDVNDILTTASDRVDTLNKLAVNVSTRLSDALATAATNITNTTIRNMAIKRISEIRQDAVDARGYLDKIRLEEPRDGIPDDIFDYEYFRWMITIVIFSLYAFIFFLSLIGLLVKSRGTLITSATVAVVCSIFIWVATGAYLGGSVAAGDLCTDPDTYFISIAQGSTAQVAVVAYIKCTDQSLPYKQVIDNAMTAVSQAMFALNETVRLAQPYSIPQMHKIVTEMNEDLEFTIGNLSILMSNVGVCPRLHQYYVAAVTSACTDTISAFGFLALVCGLLGTICTVVIFCVSCVWRHYTKQRLQSEYVSADDKDPFLPRPPPYETDYGTMGQSSPRPWSERGTLQHGNAASNDDQVMTLIYQHPYPMDESPPPAYHPGKFVPRYPESGATPGPVMRPY